jgi:hypothetical protein
VAGVDPFYSYDNYYYGQGREAALVKKWDAYTNNVCIEEAVGEVVEVKGLFRRYKKC